MAPRLTKTDATYRRPSYSTQITALVIMCLTVLACAEIQKDVTPEPIASQQSPPPWAYPIQPPVTPSPDDGVPRRVPGSNLSLTLTQIRDLYAPPDWHPDDHPPMPGVVGNGRKKRGEALVTIGGQGKTTVCATCHGQDLKGLGDVPPLAGRSPSYTVRQLYDFQSGARAGLLSALMKESVARLSIEDMISIAAYAASLSP